MKMKSVSKKIETTTFFSTFWWFHSFSKVGCVSSQSNLPAELILDGCFSAPSGCEAPLQNKTSNLVSSKWAIPIRRMQQLGGTHIDEILDRSCLRNWQRPKAPLIFLGRVLVQYILGLILLLGSVWRSLFVSFCDEQMFHMFGHISSWYIELLVVLKNTSLKLDPSIGKKKHLDLERLHTWMQLCNALLGGGFNPSEKY